MIKFLPTQCESIWSNSNSDCRFIIHIIGHSMTIIDEAGGGRVRGFLIVDIQRVICEWRSLSGLKSNESLFSAGDRLGEDVEASLQEAPDGPVRAQSTVFARL